jgi:dihydroorotase
MKILLRSALIVDKNSSHNGKRTDILIEGGEIVQIKSGIKTDDKIKVVEKANLHVSPGWMDMQADFCDPGYEHKEDIESGISAAANGGFTAVAIMPSTNPPLHSKSQIEYVKNKAKGALVDVYPLGSLSHKLEGKDLSEMYDMKLAGAVAFTDDKKPVADSGLVLRALQYAENIGSVVVLHHNEISISNGGQINEGEQSTLLGLKGIPALAEELMLERNLSILSYTGGRMHVATVSSKRSVELIREAKSKGLNVTAGVSVNNLYMDEGKLKDFDTNYKLDPPLRTREDIEALKKGLSNGTIDVVVSDHRPHDIESKDLEFDLASFGSTGIETAYSALQTSIGKRISIEDLVELLSVNPRKILSLPIPVIEEGNKANLTLFDPALAWKVNSNHFQSKSINSPLLGADLIGKVIGVIKGSQLFLVK